MGTKTPIEAFCIKKDSYSMRFVENKGFARKIWTLCAGLILCLRWQRADGLILFAAECKRIILGLLP